jgi:hypothetical protein
MPVDKLTIKMSKKLNENNRNCRFFVAGNDFLVARLLYAKD